MTMLLLSQYSVSNTAQCYYYCVFWAVIRNGLMAQTALVQVCSCACAWWNHSIISLQV